MKAATKEEKHINLIHIISIHAAREGGDINAGDDEPEQLPISIHAAREGGDVTTC